MSEPAVGQLWPSVFGHSEWKHLVYFVMADEKDVCVKICQRCVIEFCVKLGKTGNETLEMLRQAYGGETLSRAAVFQWWRHFKDGKTRVINKAKAAELLENERRLTLHELSASLNISFEHTQHIVTERYCKCVMCVPGENPGISQKSRCNNKFRCARTLFKCLRQFRIS